MLAVVVKKQNAERARLELIRLNLLDKKRRIITKADKVEIPVVSSPENLSVKFNLIEQKNPVFKSPGLSFREMRDYLKGIIGEKAGLIKGGWELVGDILIVNLPEELYSKRELIGKALLDFHPRARSVVLRHRISEPLRKPEAEVIAGDRDTTTIHKENDVIFKLNPIKVMFSAGNFSERMRMAHISSPDEKVLDMFAGIGQLCLPLAKYSSPEKVIAIEKRPETYNFLKENIVLNKLRNIEVRLGDNRDVSPENFADRILMGYFFSPESYLKTALGALKKGRGIIHYHALVKKEELDSYGERVVKLIGKEGYKAKVIYRKIIKSYAPLIWHAVYDIEVSK